MLDQPLWLPEGSVRAIITLVIVAASVIAVLTGCELPEWLVAAATLVVGFYFGTRKTTDT